MAPEGEGMRGRSRASMEKANAALADEELQLLRSTRTDLAALRPRVSDPAAYDALIAAVEESTRRNESVAALRSRVEALGAKAKQMAGEVVRLLR